MKLNKVITLYPTPYRDDNDNIITPDKIQTDTLDVSYIIRKQSNMAYAQITGIPGVLVLTSSNEDISNTTIQQLENILIQKLSNDPQTILQNLFPKSLDSDPDGPGSILSKMLSYIGITASPTCSCKQRAIEMNEKGNEWCEQNIDTIVEWLKEESANRKLIFVDSLARLIVKRSINISKKLKAKNEQYKNSI